MTKIISFIMSLIFAIDMFFVGLIPEKQLSIINTDSAAEYFVDGEGSGIRPYFDAMKKNIQTVAEAMK